MDLNDLRKGLPLLQPENGEHDRKASNRLMAHMRELGYKHVGSGNHSDVFLSKDGKKAVKLNTYSDKWLDYAEMCVKYSASNPHFLRIYDINRLPNTGKSAVSRSYNGGYIASMEPLEKIGSLEFEHHFFNKGFLFWSLLYIPSLLVGYEFPEYIVAEAKDLIRRRKEEATGIANEFMRKNRDLSQALMAIKEAFPTDHMDFKYDNVMRRPLTGELVLVDPIF